MTPGILTRANPNRWSDEAGSAKDHGLGGVRARRNLLIGHWAGGLLGLRDEALAAYAEELHMSDHAAAGDGDIIAKLKRDFAENAVAIDEREIERILRDRHRQALRETSCTE